MHSNIELAVLDILASNQQVIMSNLLCAYMRVAGFTDPYTAADAIVAFERAMDKHPDSKEKTSSNCAKLVAGIRRDYWKELLKGQLPGKGAGGLHPCPCCGIAVSAEEVLRVLNLDEEEDTPQPDPLKRAVRTKKTKTRKTKWRTQTQKPARVFDPYGPSTSAPSM